MKINIESIDHKDHRYETVGDYWDTEKGLEVRVSKMSKPEYEQLVVIHELVEKFLMDHNGVKEPDVKAFDEKFEAERAAGEHGDYEEPGDAPGAPYGREHCFATAVERMICAALGINWNDYDMEVFSL